MKKQDKLRLKLLWIFFAILILGLASFLITIFVTEGVPTKLDTWFWLLLPAVLVVLIAALMVRRTSSGVKSGFPLKDERSEKLKEKAGYKAFLVSMYFVLVLMWYQFFVNELGLPPLPEAGYLILGILFAMFIIFALFWLHYDRKGV